MFNSRIHFRTNTFDILSHLADRETTDDLYIHVRLLTYWLNHMEGKITQIWLANEEDVFS
jgi:hypothetical protein